MITLGQIIARVRQEKQNQEINLLNQNQRMKQIADMKLVEVQQNKQKMAMLEAQLREQQNLNQQLSKLTNEQQAQQFHKNVQSVSLMKIHVTSLNTLLHQLKDYFLIESNKILSNLRIQTAKDTGIVAQAEKLSRLPELMSNAQANRNLAIQVRPAVSQSCRQIKSVAEQAKNDVYNKRQRMAILFNQINEAFAGLHRQLQEQSAKNNAVAKEVEENQALVLGVSQKLRAKKDALAGAASRLKSDVYELKNTVLELKNIKIQKINIDGVNEAIQKLSKQNNELASKNTDLQNQINTLRQQIQNNQQNTENQTRQHGEVKKEQLDQMLYKIKLLKEDQKMLKDELLQKQRKFQSFINEQGQFCQNLLNCSPNVNNQQAVQVKASSIKQYILDLQQALKDQNELIMNKVNNIKQNIQKVENRYNNTLSALQNVLMLFKLDLQNVKNDCKERMKHINIENIVQRIIIGVRDHYENDSNICTIQHYDNEIAQVRYDLNKFKNSLELCKLQMQRMDWDQLFKGFTETLFNAVMNVVKIQDKVTKYIVNNTAKTIAESKASINNSLAHLRNFNYCVNLDIEDCNKRVKRAINIMCAKKEVVQRYNELQNIKVQISALRNLVSSQKSAFTYKFIGESNIIMNQLVGNNASKQNIDSPTMDIQHSLKLRFIQKDVKDEIKQLKQIIISTKDYANNQFQTTPSPNWPMRLALQINQVYQQRLQNELKDMMNISVGAGELQQENQKLQQEVSAVLTEKSGLQDELKVANSRLDEQLRLNMDLQRQIEDLLSAQKAHGPNKQINTKARPPRADSTQSFRSEDFLTDDTVNASDRILVGKSNPSLASIKTLMSLQSETGQAGGNTDDQHNKGYENVTGWTAEQFILKFSDRKSIEGNRLIPSLEKINNLRINVCTDLYKQGLYKDIEYKLRQTDIMNLDEDDAPGLVERSYFFECVIRRVLKHFKNDFQSARPKIIQILHLPTSSASPENVLYDSAVKNYILSQYDYFLEDYLCNSVFFNSTKVLKSAFNYKLRKQPEITFPSINKSEQLDAEAYLIRILILLFLAEAEPIKCNVDGKNMMIVFPELKVNNYKMPALQVKMK